MRRTSALKFLGDIIGEIISEAGVSWVATKLIPFIGPFGNAAPASTLTWRVGVAASMYYENGLDWVGGAQKQTYQEAKTLVGGFSFKTENRVDLDSLRARVPEISVSSMRTTVELVMLLRQASVPLLESWRVLMNKKIDNDIVDAVADLR